MYSKDKSTKFWAFSSQFLSILSGTIILPILLRNLTPERYAVWVAFISLAAFSLFLEQALEPALTRYVTYACAGAVDLPQYGKPPTRGNGVLNPIDLAKILQVGQKLYTLAAILVAILLGTLGTLLLAHLTSKVPGLESEALTAWGFYFFGILISVRWGYLNPTLMGLGEVTASYQATTFSRGAFFLIAACGVLATRSLIPIGVAYLTWALVLRAYGAIHLRQTLPPTPQALPDPRLFTAIADGSFRMGVSQIGAFLTLKMNYLLVSYFLGLRTAAVYGLSIQAIETITLLALTPLQYRLPQIISFRTTHAMSEFRALVGRASVEAWGISLVGAVGLLLLGPTLLKLISSQSSLLPTPMLALMCCTALLAINHSIFALLLLSDNSVPFMWASLISGMIITALSFSYLSMHIDGIIGILCIESGVQLSFNNWKWPHEAFKRYQLNFLTISKNGFKGMNSK